MPIMIITRPETIELEPPEDVPDELAAKLQKELTFDRFVNLLTTVPDAWGKTIAAVRSSVAIERAASKGNGTIELAEEDWKRLQDACEDPGRNGYGIPPWMLRQVLPFFDAVRDATEET